MELGGLANYTLAEIASCLNARHQEVLLASISVAANVIQQLQLEEQLQQQPTNLKLTPNEANNQNTQNTQQQQQQHHQQQQRSQQLTQIDNQTGQHDHLSDPYHNSQQHDSSHIDSDSNSIDSGSFEDRNSTADPQTLRTITLFADELKQRRKSIRLSQKGAAQSLRAFTGGEHPCTDAIIYHFENLQLEPERALELIPLLTDWLAWAEKHRHDGKQLPMMVAVTKVPRERKRKVVLFNEKAKEFLETAFLRNNHPDRFALDLISAELNIPTRSIRKWFTNRRQRKRFAEKFDANY